MTTSQRSKTDIANYALDLLKEPPASDIDAPASGIERTVARLYGDAADATLKMHWWKAARATQMLATISATDDEFKNVFQLPSDCLLIWTFNGREDGFERRFGQGAGRIAAHDVGPARLVYGRRLEPGETPVEIALLIGANLALLASTAAGVELSDNDVARIQKIADQREETALLISGAEGGVEQQCRSRYVDAAHGVSDLAYRPIWDR